MRRIRHHLHIVPRQIGVLDTDHIHDRAVEYSNHGRHFWKDCKYLHSTLRQLEEHDPRLRKEFEMFLKLAHRVGG